MVGNVGRLHSHGLVLCMSCGPRMIRHPHCARRLRRESSTGSGARLWRRTPLTHRTMHASQPRRPPPTPVISHATPCQHTPRQHRSATQRTRCQTPYAGTSPRSSWLILWQHTQKSHTRPLKTVLREANTHTITQIRFSNSKMKSASKNLTEASGCALASVPSSCSCSWQASSTQSRPAATTSTQPTSVRRTRTASTQAATTTRAWGTRPMMHANRGRIESLTLNASCSAWARWVCLTTPLSVVIWISSLWCI